ncbi:unnamed protein product [Lymnaea stagnalis]|uniref:Uncharacterized protein n=1 Tax=Lymnaea stagnalis TaxID=6523 RepID=A0AAV2HHJ9_LYMST
MPLSSNTVGRRTSKISVDIEIQLVESRKQKKFSVQMDGPTLRDSEAVLIT